MPGGFAHPCRTPGCHALAAPGRKYCAAHQAKAEEHERQRQQDVDNRRGSARERGYDKRWDRARKVFLAEHSMCALCLKRGWYTPATVVDHITPHRGDQHLFWDEANWQPLCAPCHSRKTAAEDGGYGNPRGR